MLLQVFFIRYISFVSGSFELFSDLTNFGTHSNGSDLLSRFKRQEAKPPLLTKDVKHCELLERTNPTPYAVIILLKSSGHYLGLGTIIDKKTVITAFKVIEPTLKKPRDILVLAGRISPWWGKNSQIKKVDEIHRNEDELVIVILKDELKFTKYVTPAVLPAKYPKKLKPEYGIHWAVLGVPRINWNLQGERVPKPLTYVMGVATTTQKPEHTKECKAVYPDLEFNDPVMLCTYANASFSWGCLGSPTIVLNQAGKLQQIAFVIRASVVEKDLYYIHLKVLPFAGWIKTYGGFAAFDQAEELPPSGNGTNSTI